MRLAGVKTFRHLALNNVSLEWRLSHYSIPVNSIHNVGCIFGECLDGADAVRVGSIVISSNARCQSECPNYVRVPRFVAPVPGEPPACPSLEISTLGALHGTSLHTLLL